MPKTRAQPGQKKPNARPNRTVTSIDDAQRYICVQGEVINAMNILQDRFFELFLISLSAERASSINNERIRFKHHASVVWHSLQSDSAQRDMAMAAISSLPTNLNLKPALQRLGYVIRILRLLTKSRNQLAHNPIMFSVVKENPAPEWLPVIGGQGIREATQRHLSKIDGLQLWKDVADDLITLANLVREIVNQIQRVDLMVRDPHFHGGLPRSWPRKPRLRSVSRLQEIDQELMMEAQKSKPNNRRPPFWG